MIIILSFRDFLFLRSFSNLFFVYNFDKIREEDLQRVLRCKQLFLKKIISLQPIHSSLFHDKVFFLLGFTKESNEIKINRLTMNMRVSKKEKQFRMKKKTLFKVENEVRLHAQNKNEREHPQLLRWRPLGLFLRFS